MPVALSYPGVYIEELPSGVRTITGVATSITGFVGRARRGPVDDDEKSPVRLFSFADFERVFGGLWADSPMSYAVYHYFLNGGSDALIVRVHDSAAAGTGSVPLLGGGNATFTAANPGAWATRLRVRVDNDIDPAVVAVNPVDTLFNLRAKDLATGVTESHLNVSITLGAPRFVGEVLKRASKLLRGPAVTLASRPTPSTATTAPTKRGAPSVIDTFRCDSVTPVARSLVRRLNSVSTGFAATTAGSMSLSTRTRSRVAQAPGLAAVKVALPPPSRGTLPVPAPALSWTRTTSASLPPFRK